MAIIHNYWSIHGLFNGALHFTNKEEALRKFNEVGTTWDARDIVLMEHTTIQTKKNPAFLPPEKKWEPIVIVSDGEDHDLFRQDEDETECR